MKVESKVNEFNPVTITLETQEELDIFTEIFHRIGGDRFRKVFGNTSTIVSHLSKNGGVYEELDVEGSIYIN